MSASSMGGVYNFLLKISRFLRASAAKDHIQSDITLVDDLGPFSISLLKLSQLQAKSWSQPSNLLQTGFLSCVQVSDLGETLTWDSS